MALSSEVLSDAIYDAINTTFKTPKRGRPSLRKLATALAEAIVTHIQENAEIAVVIDSTSISTVTTVTTSDAGLQRDPALPNNATLAPTSPVALAGVGTGTGTGTGTIT